MRSKDKRARERRKGKTIWFTFHEQHGNRVPRGVLFIYKSDVKTRVWNPSSLFISFYTSLLLLSFLLEFLISPSSASFIPDTQLPSPSFPPLLPPRPSLSPLPRQSPPVADTSLGKELFIGQVSPPVTYVGRNRATPARKRRKYKFSGVGGRTRMPTKRVETLIITNDDRGNRSPLLCVIYGLTTCPAIMHGPAPVTVYKYRFRFDATISNLSRVYRGQ